MPVGVNGCKLELTGRSAYEMRRGQAAVHLLSSNLARERLRHWTIPTGTFRQRNPELRPIVQMYNAPIWYKDVKAVPAVVRKAILLKAQIRIPEDNDGNSTRQRRATETAARVSLKRFEDALVRYRVLKIYRHFHTSRRAGAVTLGLAIFSQYPSGGPRLALPVGKRSQGRSREHSQERWDAADHSNERA